MALTKRNDTRRNILAPGSLSKLYAEVAEKQQGNKEIKPDKVNVGESEAFIDILATLDPRKFINEKGQPQAAKMILHLIEQAQGGGYLNTVTGHKVPAIDVLSAFMLGSHYAQGLWSSVTQVRYPQFSSAIPYGLYAARKHYNVEYEDWAVDSENIPYLQLFLNEGLQTPYLDERYELISLPKETKLGILDIRAKYLEYKRDPTEENTVFITRIDKLIDMSDSWLKELRDNCFVSYSGRKTAFPDLWATKEYKFDNEREFREDTVKHFELFNSLGNKLRMLLLQGHVWWRDRRTANMITHLYHWNTFAPPKRYDGQPSETFEKLGLKKTGINFDLLAQARRYK